MVILIDIDLVIAYPLTHFKKYGMNIDLVIEPQFEKGDESPGASNPCAAVDLRLLLLLLLSLLLGLLLSR